MEFRIGDQQRDMIASVRDLAQRNFKPRGLRWMDGTFPWENMKKLAAAGEVAGDPVAIAKNTFQIIVENGNPQGITGLADLAKPGLVVVLCA